MSLDMGLGDFGLGDFGLGDFGLGDFGLGDFGLGDFGLGDFGLGDFGLGDFGQGAPELDLETALGAVGGGAPNALAATLAGANVRLRWASPPVGEVATYEVFRVVGPSADIRWSFAPPILGGPHESAIVAAPLTEFLDTGVQLRGRTYGVFRDRRVGRGSEKPAIESCSHSGTLTRFRRLHTACALDGRLEAAGLRGTSREC